MAMRLPSVMSHDFAQIPGPQVERSSLDLSHGWKGSFNAGELIPILIEEVLPGDTFNCSVRVLARLNSMIRPVMDNMFLDMFFFFVPSRLLWSNFERFMGSQDNPGDSIDFEIPCLDNDTLTFDQDTIFDYACIPTKVIFADGERISALPFRAINFIWNEWFRDQNLQDKLDFPTGDGPDPDSYYIVPFRGKRHDYFTSCLLEPQKGDAAVLPISGTAPVIGDGTSMGLVGRTGTGSGSAYVAFSDDNVNGIMEVWDSSGLAGNVPSGTKSAGDRYLGLHTLAANSHVFADLSAATAVTINELRESVAFQHVMERDARSGTRYTEQLRARWGVSPRDERLQRPEYLGGSSDRINVSAVASTQPTPAAGVTNRNTQAALAAYATVGGRSGFMKSFSEYGYVIGFANLRADLTYQQGLRRMWSRTTRFDFATPELMHLGEQPVYQKEIYYADGGASAETVFGYQERYSEYRYHPSSVTSSFRTNYTGTLDSWHLAMNFIAPPVLDSAFIIDSPPVDRVLAVPSEHHLLLDAYISLRAARCMPVYAVPGLERL